MKRIIETSLLILGFICFICICSEPSEGTPTKTWIIWEICWWAALLADAAVLRLLDKKHIINLDGNGRA